MDKKKIRVKRINKNNKKSEIVDSYEKTQISEFHESREKPEIIDNDNIRSPDVSYKDTLISHIFDKNDEEMNLVLNISEQDYLDNQDISIAINNSNNDYLREFNIALELSKKEYIDKIFEDNLKKGDRIKSLESFCGKIKRLCFSEIEKKIKIYIDDILKQYFNLEIDFIYMEDIDLYNELYKIIDSYYLIPIQKNYSKTLISKEEDLIIRDIFRKN